MTFKMGFLALKVGIISLENDIDFTGVVLTLQTPAKVLLHVVISYLSNDVIHPVTLISCDKCL